MKLSEMTLTELINEAERLQYGTGISDYTMEVPVVYRAGKPVHLKGS